LLGRQFRQFSPSTHLYPPETRPRVPTMLVNSPATAVMSDASQNGGVSGGWHCNAKTNQYGRDEQSNDADDSAAGSAVRRGSGTGSR
jgi:hypothetical protein